jgi:hypothetical protein
MTESLLTRLSALTGPDRTIDEEIALAFGWTKTNSAIPPSSADPYWRSPRGQICPNVPLYTASIDAALTLVPRGAIWSVGGHVGAYWADVSVHSGSGATPAIALLIAILRAQEEGKK